MKTKWINHPVTLEGETVTLIPLEKEHFPALGALAKEKSIWEFYPFDGSDPEIFNKIYTQNIKDREDGLQYPFVIFHKKDHKIIGATRLMDIHANNRKLEIGGTWLYPDYWATEVNLECKLLLLTFCFEILEAVRVQLKTDERNIRSQKAIQKIGAKFEGILRHDMIRENNTLRNSAYFSIIDIEWPEAKKNLESPYSLKKNANK